MNAEFQEQQYVDIAEVFISERLSNQVSPSDLDSLVAELNNRILDVRVTRINPVERPQIGAGDLPTFVYVTIAAAHAVYVALKATGAQAYVETIFSEMARDHYQLARKALLNIYDKSRDKVEENANRPHYWDFPMAFVQGRTRFIFEGELSDEELVHRLRKAGEFIKGFESEENLLDFARRSDEYYRSMSDDEFSRHLGLIELNLFWDEDSNSWRLPEDIPNLQLPHPWRNIYPYTKELARQRPIDLTADMIRNLATLRDEGFISQEELEAQKTELLKRM
jgi:hypothetical protein